MVSDVKEFPWNPRIIYGCMHSSHFNEEDFKKLHSSVMLSICKQQGQQL